MQRSTELTLGEAIGLAPDQAPTSAQPPLQQPQGRDSPVALRAAPDSLEALIDNHHASVTRLAHRLLGWRGNRSDIEDIVQDVFLAALKTQHHFRGDASPWTWLAAITINRCRSHHRRKAIFGRWLRQRTPGGESSDASAPAERDETAKRVRDAVAKLRGRDRELIVLHYLEQLGVAEISKMLGISAQTIHVRLHRARTRLKRLLGDEPGNER